MTDGKAHNNVATIDSQNQSYNNLLESSKNEFILDNQVRLKPFFSYTATNLASK